MERKRSGRRYYNKRKKTWTQQCKDYLRQFIAFLFSNIGIICLVVGYTIAGAFMFIFIESAPGNSQVIIDRVTANRTGTVARLWDLTCCSAYCEDEWRTEVQAHLRSFQSHVIEAVRNFSYEGANKEMNRWSFSGSFLYSLSVITTIGECVIPLLVYSGNPSFRTVIVCRKHPPPALLLPLANSFENPKDLFGFRASS